MIMKKVSVFGIALGLGLGIAVAGCSEEQESMGDKLEAKKRAVAADVPTLPSSEDPTAGDAVGYPLLVKASAGGMICDYRPLEINPGVKNKRRIGRIN